MSDDDKMHRAALMEGAGMLRAVADKLERGEVVGIVLGTLHSDGVMIGMNGLYSDTMSRQDLLNTGLYALARVAVNTWPRLVEYVPDERYAKTH